MQESWTTLPKEHRLCKYSHAACNNDQLIPNRSADELNNVLTTNVTAVHLVIQAFLPLLEKGNLKKIVNM